MSTTTGSCPECQGQLTANGDETVCSRCGLVVSTDRLDRGPEWRSFDAESRERTGAPLTRSRHDRGLSTEIGRAGSSVSGRKRRRLARMRREHDRARIATKRDRNQVYSFSEIRRLVGALSLPDGVVERACTLFRSAQSADLLQGRSLEGFAAAAVYAVCRTDAVSRTLDEVVDAARADEDELKAAYDACNRELGLPTGPIDPDEYLPRFASRLGLDRPVETAACDLLDAARDANLLGGRNPSGVAAACLYTAARAHDADCTQADAAAVAGVSAATIRSTYHELRDGLDGSV